MNLLLFVHIRHFITRANITLLLSIIGSLGTCITFLSSYRNKRKNLKIKLSNAEYKKDQKQLLLDVSFENRSQLPIAITSVDIYLNGHQVTAESYPLCVEEYAHYHGKEVIDRKFKYNLDFPVCLQPLYAVAGQMVLDISPKDFENPSTPLTFQVHSTRGKVQQIELPCGQIKYS